MNTNEYPKPVVKWTIEGTNRTDSQPSPADGGVRATELETRVLLGGCSRMTAAWGGEEEIEPKCCEDVWVAAVVGRRLRGCYEVISEQRWNAKNGGDEVTAITGAGTWSARSCTATCRTTRDTGGGAGLDEVYRRGARLTWWLTGCYGVRLRSWRTPRRVTRGCRGRRWPTSAGSSSRR
eukprot:gene286-5417_t